MSLLKVGGKQRYVPYISAMLFEEAVFGSQIGPETHIRRRADYGRGKETPHLEEYIESRTLKLQNRGACNSKIATSIATISRQEGPR